MKQKQKMKNFLFIGAVLLSVTAFAQNIKVEKGQKFIVKNIATQNMEMGMGVEQKGNTEMTATVEISEKTKAGYQGTATVTKMVVASQVFGQDMNYDSDKKEGNNEMMAGMFDKIVGQKGEFLLDGQTGKATETTGDKPAIDKPAVDKPGLPGADMGNMENLTGVGLVNLLFYVLPTGKIINDTWSDSALVDGNKTMATYKLGATEGGLTKISYTRKSNFSGDTEAMGQTVTTEIEMTETGYFLVDQATGIVKSRTFDSQTTGKFSVMGQEMSINGNGKTTITVE